MTLKVTKGNWKQCYLIGHYHFLFVICSNHVYILHHFQSIACNLNKSTTFVMKPMKFIRNLYSIGRKSRCKISRL